MISWHNCSTAWWRHQLETFSALLAISAENSPVTGEFPAQRPVTQSFGVFFDLCLNKRLSKQSWGWWFETPLRPLWRPCNGYSPKSHSGHEVIHPSISYIKIFFQSTGYWCNTNETLWLYWPVKNKNYRQSRDIISFWCVYHTNKLPLKIWRVVTTRVDYIPCTVVQYEHILSKIQYNSNGMGTQNAFTIMLTHPTECVVTLTHVCVVASQITNNSALCATVCTGSQQQQDGNQWWQVDSPQKGPTIQKVCVCVDTMCHGICANCCISICFQAHI